MSEDSGISRRSFIGLTSQAGLGIAVSGTATAKSASIGKKSPHEFPETNVTTGAGLKVGQIVRFNYPDPASPCIAMRLSAACKDGVGPQNDIVAYSTLCPHQGFPLTFDAQKNAFRCPGHYSQFDPEKSGQMICGQATEKLARIKLSYDQSTDAIRAIGVEGLIYGRVTNLI